MATTPPTDHSSLPKSSQLLFVIEKLDCDCLSQGRNLSGLNVMRVHENYLRGASLTQLLPPHLPWFPDCVHFRCCSPNASASAAASRLRPLQLLLLNCVHFSCCSPIGSAASRLGPLLPDCIRFSCCSPIGSTVPRLGPLFPDWVRCSLIVSASAGIRCSPTAFVSAAQPSSGRVQPLREHSQSSRFSTFSTKVAHHYGLVQPPEHPTSVTHTHT